LWAYLQMKYSQIDATTANIKIQTFTFVEGTTVTEVWEKLKDYRRKLRAADTNAKSAYNHWALLLVLVRSLPKSFATTIDTISARGNLTVEDKLKYLEEKESRARNEDEQAHAAIRVRSDEYTPPHRRRHSSDFERSKSPRNKPKCYLCDERYWMRDCP
ncbi:hypothetical protein BJ878DRAFT_388211, partial [Calycina marina]